MLSTGRIGIGGRRAARGFSLVEMMIAVVAALVVLGAVLAYIAASANAAQLNVKATRLTQELRTTLSLMTREIRRIGYDRNNYTAIGAGVFSFPYSTLTIGTNAAGTANSCLLMAYDRFGINDGATSPGATERKGFRVATAANGSGVIQINLVDNPPVCNAVDADWIELSNPQTVDITGLSFALNSTTTVAGTNPNNGNNIVVTVRDVTVTAAGRLVSDSSVTRTVTEQVRVRSDNVSN